MTGHRDHLDYPDNSAHPSDSAHWDTVVQRLNLGIDRAIALVAQMLELARQEAQSSLATEAVDLHTLARDTIAPLLAQAQAKHIDLGLASDSTLHLPPVAGHPDGLHILLRNLLDNAIKYTPEQGRVDVELLLDAGLPVLAVDDSGPGIAPAARERAFDRFFRVPETSASSATNGSGLGLAIVKAIADRHSATLVLTTSPRLGGLRVEVRFTQLPAPQAT